MIEAIQNNGKTDNKDKKILDLAKKNRSLQLQVESLKTKAAKAAEFALKMKNERDNEEQESMSTSSPKKTGNITMAETTSTISGLDLDKKVKECEKKITKLRNEK